MNEENKISKSWFKRTSNFWVRIPDSPEALATILLSWAIWIILGFVLDVFHNPGIISVFTFILIGGFLYLAIVWIAHKTDQTTFKTLLDIDDE